MEKAMGKTLDGFVRNAENKGHDLNYAIPGALEI